MKNGGIKMGWENSTESGCVWYNSKETQSISGTRTDMIFGFLGVGSPHGHNVTFNERAVYSRPYNGLIAEKSGTEVVVTEQKLLTMTSGATQNSKPDVGSPVGEVNWHVKTEYQTVDYWLNACVAGCQPPRV